MQLWTGLRGKNDRFKYIVFRSVSHTTANSTPSTIVAFYYYYVFVLRNPCSEIVNYYLAPSMRRGFDCFDDSISSRLTRESSKKHISFHYSNATNAQSKRARYHCIVCIKSNLVPERQMKTVKRQIRVLLDAFSFKLIC